MVKSWLYYINGEISILENQNILMLNFNYKLLMGKKLYPNHIDKENYDFDIDSIMNEIINKYQTNMQSKMLNCDKLYDTLFIF